MTNLNSNLSKHLPRGIAPELLLSQIQNTMPYLLTSPGEPLFAAHFPPAEFVRIFAGSGFALLKDTPLTHFEYFKLCLSAHYLTCATPVPTDVDNQIRFKLWPAALPLETAVEMTRWILDSQSWDFTTVSRRYVTGAAGTPWEKEVLGGHQGEWFTVATAAYCALLRYSDAEARIAGEEVLAAIADEVRRHSEIFGSLWNAADGISALKAAANIAHNFGDLDRVMDMWELAVNDPLRLEYYHLTVAPFDSNRKLRYLGRLWVAGELYKSPIDGSSLAFENHRHFALRKPRCLRQSVDFLVPNGPFFDHWGKKIAQSSDRAEVMGALVHGWKRLPKTVGYGRSLHGIRETCGELEDMRTLLELPEFKKTHPFRKVLETSQEVFESRWNDAAVKWMDEIPSRASVTF